MHRYLISRDFVKDKEVLDIASGEGYGSSILATRAKNVIGVDIDAISVQHASEAYSFNSNLSYKVGSADSIPLPDASLDVVVSFETIEHHDKHAEMLTEIKRILRPGGLLIISSPNRPIYSEAQNFKNPFHVKELDFEEFDTLLKSYFSNIVYFGQSTLGGSFVFKYPQQLDNFTVLGQTPAEEGSPAQFSKDPTFFIAFCSDAAVPDNKPSIYLDPENDLVAQIKNEATRMQQSFDKNYAEHKTKMEENQDYISHLDSVLKKKDEDHSSALKEFETQFQEFSRQRDELSKQNKQLADYIQQLTDQREDLLKQLDYFKKSLETEHETLTNLQNSKTVQVSNRISGAVNNLRNRIKPKS